MMFYEWHLFQHASPKAPHPGCFFVYIILLCGQYITLYKGLELYYNMGSKRDNATRDPNPANAKKEKHVMKIALIAHDKKKEEIIELAKKYKDVLAAYELYATGTTGTLIMGETALPIHRMKSGPLGGDQQIGAMLANGELGLIIFLRDPLTAQPHEPDVSALLRLCDVQKIPLATNVSSATIMLEALKQGTFAASFLSI